MKPNEGKPVNSLTRLADFKSLLMDYRPSQSAIDQLNSTRPLFLVGPTAAGRNTLINILTDTGKYHYMVSDTTRKPRSNNGVMEQHGHEYWFRTEEEFIEGLKAGKYLEAAVIHGQQVSGISIDEVVRASQSGMRAIDEIEVAGAAVISRFLKDGLFIFLLPPTFDVWMQRLRGRGNLDDSEIRRRMLSAESEIILALESDMYHFIINNNIYEAAKAVEELANGRDPDEQKQQYGRDHAQQLVAAVRLYQSEG